MAHIEDHSQPLIRTSLEPTGYRGPLAAAKPLGPG